MKPSSEKIIALVIPEGKSREPCHGFSCILSLHSEPLNMLAIWDDLGPALVTLLLCSGDEEGKVEGLVGRNHHNYASIEMMALPLMLLNFCSLLAAVFHKKSENVISILESRESTGVAGLGSSGQFSH